MMVWKMFFYLRLQRWRSFWVFEGSFHQGFTSEKGRQDAWTHNFCGRQKLLLAENDGIFRAFFCLQAVSLSLFEGHVTVTCGT